MLSVVLLSSVNSSTCSHLLLPLLLIGKTLPKHSTMRVHTYPALLSQFVAASYTASYLYSHEKEEVEVQNAEVA